MTHPASPETIDTEDGQAVWIDLGEGQGTYGSVTGFNDHYVADAFSHPPLRLDDHEARRAAHSSAEPFTFGYDIDVATYLDHFRAHEIALKVAKDSQAGALRALRNGDLVMPVYRSRATWVGDSWHFYDGIAERAAFEDKDRTAPIFAASESELRRIARNHPKAIWKRVLDTRWYGGIEDFEHAAEVAKLVHKKEVEADARLAFMAAHSPFGLFDPTRVMLATDIDNTVPIPDLIEGVVEAGSLAMLFASSYVGKSFVALDWALSIASGHDWNGRHVTPGRVLYLAMEGQTTIRKRQAAWAAHHGVDLAQCADRFVMYPNIVNFFDQDSLNVLAGYAEAEQFDLIIVDTVNKSFGAGDENSTADMTAYGSALDRLREASTNGSVLVVHHARKDNPMIPRGSSALFAAMDVVWAMTKDDEKNPARKLECLKMKSGEASSDLHLRFDGGVLVEDTNPGSDPLVRMLAEMSLDGPVTRSELKQSAVDQTLYGTLASASTRITNLIKTGLIVADGDVLTVASGN